MAAILFVMKYPLHQRENLKAKFDGQMAAADALGYEAYCIGWDREGFWLLRGRERSLLLKSRFTHVPGYDHTLIFNELMAAVMAALNRRDFSVLYLRYMPTFRGALTAMKALKAQGGKLVLEFPTYPNEQENRRSLIRRSVFAYTNRVLKRIHPLVDLYTVIGEPCNGSIDGCPAMNIVNGVDVRQFPLHTPNPQDAATHLLALASMAGWHGYDRAIRGLAIYPGLEQVQLHMVGGDGDGSLAIWKRLAVELDLRSRVVFHGPLYGKALDEVVAGCDVGIGSLAMFRYGLRQGMSLKLREYMARGLPFIFAVEDPAIPDNPRFCQRMPHDTSPIDIESVVTFAKQAKADPLVSGEMRAYAKEHMSWESVMQGVFRRLEV